MKEPRQHRYYLIRQDIHSILRRVHTSLDTLQWPQDDDAMKLGKVAADDLTEQIERLHRITARLGQHVLGAAVKKES